MLNHGARYFPILRAVKKYRNPADVSILEIGCGPKGLSEFHKAPFVGCDVAFGNRIKWPMMPVMATATALPFPDKTFDVVIASDVLEHVPPAARKAVLDEAKRVAKDLVVFGFPCGKAAHRADRLLLDTYLSRGLDPPVWLREHMLAAFPDDTFFDQVHGWKVTSFGNENLKFHLWMMRMEMQKLFNYGAMVSLRLAPRFFEFLLRKADRPPFYRQIFVLQRLE